MKIWEPECQFGWKKENKMAYRFAFYTKDNFEQIQQMILDSYKWDFPIFGLSRFEFSAYLHPEFTGLHRVWERTCGLWFDGDKIAGCAINEANDEGDVFFLFDSRRRAEDISLIEKMIHFAKTSMSVISDDKITRCVKLHIPKWHTTLKNLAEKSGFTNNNWNDRILILPFSNEKFDVSLPYGYTFATGTEVPAFYSANVHMAAFNYNIKDVKNSEKAFDDLRKAPHYNPEFSLYILDMDKRPVAFANIWYDEKMPYCELEPLGVAWWERRKGLATAILYETANRIKEKFPQCNGMTGGDQTFYEKIGFAEKATCEQYAWQQEIFPSWDKRSEKIKYEI